MIKQENRQMNGKIYCVHFSDDNKMIQQEDSGKIYSEAWDVIPCKYTYTETDIENIDVKHINDI